MANPVPNLAQRLGSITYGRRERLLCATAIPLSALATLILVRRV